MADLTVWADPPGLPRTQIAASRIPPESFNGTANPKGPDTANFLLRRPTDDPVSDLMALTPVDIDCAGQRCWEGFVYETPKTQSPTDEFVTVNCRGWQYHWDDDVVDRNWVHSKLADWQDLRTAPTAQLGANRGAAIGQVNADSGGAITLMTPNAVQVPTSMWVGVYLDMGQETTAARIVIDWSASNGATAFQLFARAADYPDALSFGGGQFSDAWAGIPNNVGSGISAGNFSTPKRYVNIFMYCTATSTPAADVWFRLNKISVYRDTTYESGSGATPGSSIFFASTLVKDILPFCPRINQTTERIAATVTPLPSMAPREPQTPGFLFDAGNSLHNWQLRMWRDRTLIFEPLQTVPTIEVGDWTGWDFQDASANSAEDICNRAIVEGTGADGLPLRISRSAAEQPSAVLEALTSPAPTNPGFESVVTGWTTTNFTGTTITRTTVGGEIHSGVGAGKWVIGTEGAGEVLTGTMTGTFLAGTPYVLRFYARALSGAYVQFSLTWTPRVTVASGVTFQWVNGFGFQTFYFGTATDYNYTTWGISQVSSPSTWYIDDMQIFAAQPTLADKLGFTKTKRIPVGSIITPAVGTTIADTYLQAHIKTPFKGSLTIDPGGARLYGSAFEPHPSTLLMRSTELVRFANQIDPDTGGLGRDGSIASVSYDNDSERASVSIDNQRDNLAVVLARYALVSGG